MNDLCSIVIPVYYNEESINKTITKLKESVIEKSDHSFEIVFVDDGSGDDSFKKLIQAKESSGLDIKIVKLSRNFGQRAAMLAGMKYSSGKYIVNISADLQDPPELIHEMLDTLVNEDYKMVIAHRENRKESLYRRFTSRIFYGLLRRLCFPQMPEGGFDYFMINEEVKDILLNSNEINAFLQGQLLWTGYKYKLLPYTRQNREDGKSKWTFSKKIKLVIDSIMSYSYFPLRLMSISGFIIAFIGFIYALIIVYGRIFGNLPFKGWAPLMILILILSGFQMIMLGVIGEYLWRALDQVRNRPKYIVEEVVE
ncbi:MAG: glycosyltransferase family 2 protein [Saprospiraceae bacterium]|nr:glycosyltransferase family 2 protein [Saprospiraceae bacterium]